MEKALHDILAPCGRVRAYEDDVVIPARGIRYARAERFCPPLDEPPLDLIDGSTPGPASPQLRRDRNGGMSFDQLGGLPISADYLRLRVTMPKAAVAEAGLPAPVSKPGGDYVAGAGDAEIYDPHTLSAEQGIIVVSVTYRLGVLGYLGTGRPEHSNLGVLDQISALRWVQANISSFGGD